MAERPTALKWIGPMTPEGNPARWMPGIPARDLTERDMRRLSDEQVAEALACGFYEKPGGGKARPAAAVAAEPAGEE